MNLNTDHHFAIGHLHRSSGKPCQDYAISGITQTGRAFAVVSDGCSDRHANHTDVGARIVTLHARRFAREFSRLDDFFWSDTIFANRLLETGYELMLRPNDLNATLVYAIVERDRAWARLLGDGVVVRGFEDGTRIVERFDWADERPYYPAYVLIRDLFVTGHGGIDVEALKLTRVIIEPDGSIAEPEVIAFTVGTGIEGITIPFSTDRLVYVALFSDGICRIDQLDWLDAVRELTDFKVWPGAFVKRRMSRFLKDVVKRGNGPVDDLSCAAIHIEHAVHAALDQQ